MIRFGNASLPLETKSAQAHPHGRRCGLYGTSVSLRWAKWRSKANASVIRSRSMRANEVASTYSKQVVAGALAPRGSAQPMMLT